MNKIPSEIWIRAEEGKGIWISSEGRVFREPFRTFLGNKERWNGPKLIEHFHKSPKGYRRVCIQGTVYFIHRLVAKYFVSNSSDKPQVNHKDGDKNNNKMSNLEWVSNQENRDHAVANNLHPCRLNGKSGTIKLKIKDVEEIMLNYCTGTWRQRELADLYNVCQQTISKIIKANQLNMEMQ